MEENSFETLNYLTPGDQDPSQSEEEDLEDPHSHPPSTLQIDCPGESL